MCFLPLLVFFSSPRVLIINGRREHLIRTVAMYLVVSDFVLYNNILLYGNIYLYLYGPYITTCMDKEYNQCLFNYTNDSAV